MQDQKHSPDSQLQHIPLWKLTNVLLSVNNFHNFTSETMVIEPWFNKRQQSTDLCGTIHRWTPPWWGLHVCSTLKTVSPLTQISPRGMLARASYPISGTYFRHISTFGTGEPKVPNMDNSFGNKANVPAQVSVSPTFRSK